MYCSNCGVKADGNFCVACGNRLQAPAEVPPQAPSEIPLQAPAGVVWPSPADVPPHEIAAGSGWVDEVVYEKLLQFPEVRERIVLAGKRSPKKMTGEQFLAMFDTVVPTGVAIGKLTVALLPIWDRIGLKTGKQAELSLSAPVGRALLATLCALASQDFEMKKVDQLSDGCVLTTLIPSTMWTNRGELVVSLQKQSHAIQIQAATKISGQLIDWGKSKRVLRDLFDEIHRELSSQPSSDGFENRHVA